MDRVEQAPGPVPPAACRWQVPAYLDYVQPSLTPALVADAEARLGVRLPEALLELLREQNGGYLRGSFGVSSVVAGIGPQHPNLVGEAANWAPASPEPGRWAPTGSALLIPFDGDGHWHMCLDYREVGREGEPAVTFVDLEMAREERIAPSFSAYLERLVDESTAKAWRVRAPTTPEAVSRQLAAELGAAPPTVDQFGLGYPVWRVAVPGAPYEWAWCTPNEVPAGFRREGNRLITTPARALRLPEAPEISVFVSATEASALRVAEVLARLGLIPA